MTHCSRPRRAMALLLTLLVLAALTLPALAVEDAPEADTGTTAQTDPFAALTWWVIPLALLIALLGGGALRLLLRTPERWGRHYEKKYDRFTPKSPKNENEERK